MTTHRITNRDLTGEDADGNKYAVKCEFVERESSKREEGEVAHWEISAINARLEDGRELQRDGDIWKTTSGKELALHVSGTGVDKPPSLS